MSDNLTGIQSHSTRAFWDEYFIYEIEGEDDEIEAAIAEMKKLDISCDTMRMKSLGEETKGIMVSQSAYIILEDIVIRSDMTITELYVVSMPDMRGRRMIKRQAGLPIGMLFNIGTTGNHDNIKFMVSSMSTGENYAAINNKTIYTSKPVKEQPDAGWYEDYNKAEICA